MKEVKGNTFEQVNWSETAYDRPRQGEESDICSGQQNTASDSQTVKLPNNYTLKNQSVMKSITEEEKKSLLNISQYDTQPSAYSLDNLLHQSE